MTSQSKFRFKKHDNIGVSDAEQDQNFLYNCFVDTGDLDALRDTNSPRRIVLGRTGAGKTASPIGATSMSRERWMGICHSLNLDIDAAHPTWLIVSATRTPAASLTTKPRSIAR